MTHTNKQQCNDNQQACIIDTGDRLTLAASLDTLYRRPDLLDQVVSSLFNEPQRQLVEVIIDRPSRDADGE